MGQIITSSILPFATSALAMLAAIIASAEMLKKRRKAGIAIITIAILSFFVSISVTKTHMKDDNVRHNRVDRMMTDIESTVKKLEARGLISPELRPFLDRINEKVQYVKEISAPSGNTMLDEYDEPLSQMDRIEEALYALMKTDIPQLKNFMNQKFNKTEGTLIQSRQMSDDRLANENRVLREQLALSIAEINSLFKGTEEEIKDSNARKTDELLKAISKAVFELAEF